MKINHSFILNSVNQRQFNVRKDDSLPPPENNTNPEINDSTPDTECVLENDETNQIVMDSNYNASIKSGVQPLEVNRSKSVVVSQTVLDMLGFISGMKKMTIKYPYIIQGVTGLDTAYNKHYGIKDPYLGSGEDKITLTCCERKLPL